MRRRDFIAALATVGAAGWAHAQGNRLPKLAVLSPTFNAGGHSDLVYGPFTAALAELGWTAGQNIEIIERFADDQHELLPPRPN
jgi:hypothetical protein